MSRADALVLFGTIALIGGILMFTFASIGRSERLRQAFAARCAGVTVVETGTDTFRCVQEVK